MPKKPSYEEMEQRIQELEQVESELKTAEKALRESEERYKNFFDNSLAGLFRSRLSDGMFIEINSKAAEQLGLSVEEVVEKVHSTDLYQNPDQRKELISKLKKDGEVHGFETDLKLSDGRDVTLSISVKAYPDKDYMEGAVIDITERKLAENALKESEYNYRTLFDNSPDLIVLLNSEGKFLDLNKKFEEESGYRREEIIGKSVFTSGILAESSVNKTIDYFKEILAGKKLVLLEVEGVTKDGSKIPYELMAVPIKKDGKIVAVQATLRNITERRQTDQEKDKLKAQLIQAQKMESVGRLAGGVAHDINNKMLVIFGYAELIQETLRDSDPIYEFVKEIIAACKKSTDIVNQLLAFARKQTISPKVFDLNEIVEKMLKMLRRLIGEDINLVWRPSAHLWPVKIDPSQIDQILANLCVNARDAVSGVGKITIETGKTVFDEEYCFQHAGFIPGKFVMLAVSDNGCGMNKETLDNIFEPFFTTKPIGKGTGLGLSIIYGIVKQNNGFINVYSEPGKGTTIKMYLPKHSGRIEELIDNNAQQVPAGFGETVLVVEDEKTIMKMSRIILEKLGYRVLTADTPGKALHLVKEHSGKIHLLITDVIMPDINGWDLADQINKLYPNIKTLFMSGYTANVIAHHGVLDEGMAFIQKPFSNRDLAVKVREVLDEAPGKTQASLSYS